MSSDGNKCPKCGGDLPEFPAISRVDNKTLICSDCGRAEGMHVLIRRLNEREDGDSQ